MNALMRNYCDDAVNRLARASQSYEALASGEIVVIMMSTNRIQVVGNPARRDPGRAVRHTMEFDKSNLTTGILLPGWKGNLQFGSGKNRSKAADRLGGRTTRSPAKPLQEDPRSIRVYGNRNCVATYQTIPSA